MYTVVGCNNQWHISMVQCNNAVSTVRYQWRFCSLALSHQYVEWSTDMYVWKKLFICICLDMHESLFLQTWTLLPYKNIDFPRHRCSSTGRYPVTQYITNWCKCVFLWFVVVSNASARVTSLPMYQACDWCNITDVPSNLQCNNCNFLLYNQNQRLLETRMYRMARTL